MSSLAFLESSSSLVEAFTSGRLPPVPLAVDEDPAATAVVVAPPAVVDVAALAVANDA